MKIDKKQDKPRRCYNNKVTACDKAEYNFNGVDEWYICTLPKYVCEYKNKYEEE